MKTEAEPLEGGSACIVCCGERGIRTPGSVARTTVFKTAAIDHSAISPFISRKYNVFYFPPLKVILHVFLLFVQRL
jgi:hypothetical protein